MNALTSRAIEGLSPSQRSQLKVICTSSRRSMLIAQGANGASGAASDTTITATLGHTGEGAEAVDSTLEVAALVLGGQRWLQTIGTGIHVEDRDQMIALCYRCAVLFTELWAALAMASMKCVAPSTAAVYGEPFRAAMVRLTMPFETVLAPLLAQMAAVLPPGSRDTTMSDAADLKMQSLQSPRLSPGLSPRMSPRLSPLDKDSGLAPGTKSDLTSSSTVDNGETGLYPSETTRLAICLRILHVWRHDLVSQQLQSYTERLSSTLVSARSNPVNGFTGSIWDPQPQVMSAAANPGASGYVAEIAQLVAQVRARASVLCTVLSHSLNNLFGLVFAATPADPVRRLRPAANTVNALFAEQDSIIAGNDPHFKYSGSGEQFRYLILIIEVALHLLHTYLNGVCAAGDMGNMASAQSPSLGAPRLGLVVEQLQVLRKFTEVVCGTVKPVERPPVNYASMTERNPLGQQARALNAIPVDLVFAACIAERVEQQLVDLQAL